MKSLHSIAAVLVLSSAFVVAQSASPVQAPTAPAKKPAVSHAAGTPSTAKAAPGASVADDEAVVSIDAPCPAPKVGDPKPNCKKIVTAAEFRRLASAVSPNMPVAAQRAFAQNLGRMLAYSNEASRLGLQNTRDGKALMELARMQALAQLLGRKVREQSDTVTPADIQTFYNENKGKFESTTLERILIPAKKAEGAEPNKQAEMDYAAQLRTRWLAGEDPEKLQKEAFERSGTAATPPSIKLGERSPKSLPSAQDKALDLKVGEITEPIYDPAGVVLLKVVSKQSKPLAQVQDDIKTTLKNQRLESLVHDLDNRTPAKINEAFFAAQEPPAPAPGKTASPSEAVPVKEPKK